MSVRLPPDARGCFEAVETLHELGHHELGDPMHSSPLWDEVDAQFAGIVRDRPGAPPKCIERCEGIPAGVWSVRRERVLTGRAPRAPPPSRHPEFPPA